MPTQQSRMLSVDIDAPYEAAYDFAHRPENFPKWAAGLSKSLHKTDHGWVTDSPDGETIVEFSPENDYGVLDHHVRPPGKPEVYIPLRMVRNGEGVEVSLLLLRQPEMDDAMFEKDAEAITKDLASLKTLLESR